MKKFFLFLLAIILLILSGCSDKTSPPSVADPTGSENIYSFVQALWYPKEGVQGVLDVADYVFTAKITGISFQVLDALTGLPPTNETDKYDKRLNTIYDIEVIASYKGDITEFNQIRDFGGIQGDMEEEQLAVLAEYDLHYIPIYLGIPQPAIKLGETYLFASNQNWPDRTIKTIPCVMVQGVHHITDPFKEHYDVSAKKILSALGTDVWEDFWTQWQEDYPEWDTWLDRDAVERALETGEYDLPSATEKIEYYFETPRATEPEQNFETPIS